MEHYRTHQTKQFHCPARTIGLLVLATLILALPIAASAETVKRIKLIIDDQSYLWEMGEPMPQRVEGQFQGPAFPLAVATIKPGQNYNHSALQQKVVDTQRLLDNSALFNDVQVFFLDSSTDETVCTFFIILKTGFSLRFGGGIAWFMIGNDNTDGQLLNWRAWLGYNRAGAAIGQGLPELNLAPWFWQAKLLYQNNGLDSSVNAGWVHTPSLQLLVGTASYPWFARLSVLGSANFSQFGGGNQMVVASPQVGLENTWSFDYLDADDAVVKAKNSIVAGINVGIDEAWLQPEGELRNRLNGQAYLRGQIGILTLATQVYGVWSVQAVPDRFAIDLKDTDDRSVRGDYPDDYLLWDHALLSNSELRLRVAQFKWGIISEFDIDPFLFFDQAWGGRHNTDRDSWFDRSATAYGLGLRLLLGNPVDTDFSFSLGLTPHSFDPNSGRLPLRFAMTVTAGF